MTPDTEQNRRILIVDDNEAIHDDFQKILCGPSESVALLSKAESELFGDDEPADADGKAIGFEIQSALQGQDAVSMYKESLKDGKPFALAFVDMRMPPGWDGVETIRRMWEVDPRLQVVICTAFSDYSWEQIHEVLGTHDGLLILKKPFDSVEVVQLATALTKKWTLTGQAQMKMESLETQVKERTKDIEQQRQSLENTLAELEQAQLQLLQADKMASIGQLAAGVAHEINNPIGFISSNLNSLSHYINDIKEVMLAYDALLPDCVQFERLVPGVEMIQKLCEDIDIKYVLSDLDELVAESVEGTHRVRQIVADLKDFSHIDTHEVVIENINNLIDKTINVAWNELKYRTTVIRQYGDIPDVPCYGGKLAQVFLNLLLNAADAIEEKGDITVRTGTDEETSEIWFEIEDTGCGISEEGQRKIFEPFYTTKDVGKGTGLGLHLVHSIMQAHGGTIRVKSAPGKGTSFHARLPIDGPPEVKGKLNAHAA